MEMKEIYADIAAFADDENDVIIDKGLVVFQRNRQTYECRLLETAEGVEVEYDHYRIPYKRFLAEELGRLSILAEAIRQKRKDVQPYIDTQAIRSDSLDSKYAASSAIETVREECRSRPLGETKLIFLTADAGHGKTALLRRLSQRFATEYVERKSDMLLLHVDTQGRSFVRLEEAVAGDLGQLRISGLFYSGVIRLIRRGLLAIAIDGFDELLAEIGFTEAYSGLGAFLRQLDGNGVVIASARSAYFEAENYSAQTKLLNSLPNTHVTMQLLRLQPWSRTESVQYFCDYEDERGRRIPEPEQLYDLLSDRLGAEHPVLHRPFLVHRMAALLAATSGAATELAEELGTSSLKVVPNVIHALLKREVEEKWRDPNGHPYLTLDQHIILLAAIADELWVQGKNSLPVEVVQLVCEAVVDTLGLPPARRVQVVQRIKAHALLPPSGTVSGDLAFDHEEFLNYFLAARLVQLFKTNDAFGLQRFLEFRSLPLIVGTWTANIESWSPKHVKSILERLNQMTGAEVRSTYLKQNAGLLASQLASYHSDEIINYEFDSMYFEGEEWSASQLREARFDRCTFTDIDLSGATWTDCMLAQCRVDGITLDHRTILKGTHFDAASVVVGVLRSSDDGDHRMRNYVPDECREILSQHGAVVETQEIEASRRKLAPVPKEKRKALDSFLRIFARNSGATEGVMKMKLGAKYGQFHSKILPLLLDHGVVRRTNYVGGGTPQERYELNHAVDTILKAEDPDAPLVAEGLKNFWNGLRDLK
jgi:hypothetical protein